MKKTFIIIVGILIIILVGLKFYNPNSNNNSIAENIKDNPTYSTKFTVLSAQILEEMYTGDKDYGKIQNQINKIDNNKLKEVLQANLNQYKLNSSEFANKLTKSENLTYVENALKNTEIMPFDKGALLGRGSEVVVKGGNRFYKTIAYLAYSNLKNTAIDDNNKNIYGISVFNVYSDGQIEPLYISIR